MCFMQYILFFCALHANVLFAGSNRISSENAGRQPNAITEGVGEGRDILISHALCDALDRQVGRLEQVLSAIETHQDDVFMRGVAAFPLEQA